MHISRVYIFAHSYFTIFRGKHSAEEFAGGPIDLREIDFKSSTNLYITKEFSDPYEFIMKEIKLNSIIETESRFFFRLDSINASAFLILPIQFQHMETEKHEKQ